MKLKVSEDCTKFGDDLFEAKPCLLPLPIFINILLFTRSYIKNGLIGIKAISSLLHISPVLTPYRKQGICNLSKGTELGNLHQLFKNIPVFNRYFLQFL